MIRKFYPLRLVPDNINFDFIGKRWLCFSFSIIMILLSIASIVIKGINYGIDFTGGVLIEAKADKPIDIAKMRYKISNLNLGEISLQSYGSDQEIMLRLGKNKASNLSDMKSVEKIKNAISKEFSDLNIEYRKVDFVGPQIGSELIKNAVLATLFSFIAIMIYIWIRFEWQYGIGLIIALIHDAILTIGFISITQLEFNLTSIAAILTIIGYSVNDSVVIYDRIRENTRTLTKTSIANLLNNSINSTLSRTIMTVMTTLLSTLALTLFGGEAIKGFSIIVFYGIIVGTYSSIFLSAPILIYFEKKS